MTDRERWTVYPLLFLALGASLKDKLTETVSTKNVHCEKLVCNEVQTKSVISGSVVVINDDNRQAAAIASNEHGGFVETLGTQTGVLTKLGNFGKISGLLFIDAQGNAHVGPVFASPIPLRQAPPADDEDASPQELQPSDLQPAEKPDADAVPEPADETPPSDDGAA